MLPCLRGNCLSRLLESISRALIIIDLVSAGSITVSTVPCDAATYGFANLPVNSSTSCFAYSNSRPSCAIIFSNICCRLLICLSISSCSNPLACKVFLNSDSKF